MDDGMSYLHPPTFALSMEKDLTMLVGKGGIGGV
jgi:hypothetical protein